MKEKIKPHIKVRVHEYDDAIFITGWASVRFHLKRKHHIPFLKDFNRKKWNYRKHFAIIAKEKLKKSEKSEIIKLFKQELIDDINRQFENIVKKLRKKWSIVKIEDAL